MYFILVIKAAFSSLLQSSVSQDPPEITRIWLIAAQETFLIIINDENGCAVSFFVESDSLPFKS